jgi:hypothetical protein
VHVASTNLIAIIDYIYICTYTGIKTNEPRRRGLVVSSPPTELRVVRSNAAEVYKGGSFLKKIKDGLTVVM